MGIERKKKKNGDSANSIKIQTIKIPTKTGKRKRSDSTSSQVDNKKLFIPNSVTYNLDRALGNISRSTSSIFSKRVIIDRVKRFGIHKLLSPFDRRVTAITWHPKYPQVSVAGSKGGDLILHNFNETDDYFCPGVGAGGSILGLKCSIDDPCTVFTASLTGKICCEDFHRSNSKVLFSLPLCLSNWFTSLDICYNRHFLLTGDCAGNCYILKSSGELVQKNLKIHSSKVSHCEFNLHDPNIFVSASIDNTVKLWDLRSMAETKPQPLMFFKYSKGVNSACFSSSNGLSLLTTDQHSELRVYSSPCWNETLSITHPHRQFQHMTPIKASWHPMEDIIIVGRYPDDKIIPHDSRTIDFYDASNGQILHKIPSPSKNIVSLSAMNSTGDAMAVAAGFSITYLKDANLQKEISSKHESDEETETTAVDLNSFKKMPKATSKTAKKISSSKSNTKSKFI